MYWIDLGTEVAALNSQAVPISQVILKTGFTVSVTIGMCHVVMKLQFENCVFDELEDEIYVEQERLSISSDVFFDVFPFNIVFNRSMVIRNIGAGLEAVMPGIVGYAVDEVFNMTRPLLEFTLENVRLLSLI